MTDNLEIHKVKERIKMNNMKQTQDDRTIQPFNCSTIQRVKAYAFTLAETLIVIGIIGVVAALTLPNLNHATGDKEKVTKVKKIYSALTDAVDRAQVIYGPCDEWTKDIEGDNAARSERFAKRITEFMKVSKDCGFSEGCYSQSPLLLDDGEVLEDNYLDSLIVSNRYMLTLSDGMSLSFGVTPGSIKIGVDIDGPNNGKNQIGSDIFDFTIFIWNCADFELNQLYPSIKNSSVNGKLVGGDFISYHNVTAWVIQNENLDYLKCPDELNWETKTSCE